MRERLEVARLLNVVENDIVRNWSCDRDAPGNSHNEVASEPRRTLKTWTAADQWAASKAESLQSGNSVFVSSSTLDLDHRTAVKEQEKQFAAASWASFDDYTKSRKSRVESVTRRRQHFHQQLPRLLQKEHLQAFSGDENENTPSDL